MKALFILPRFHTNIFYALSALRSRGHEVELWVENVRSFDDYSLLTPRMLKPDDLSWKNLLSLLRSVKPDVIVIRHHTGKWGRIYWAAKYLGIKTVAYDQRPLHKPRSFVRRVREMFAGKPFPLITPVKGFGDKTPAPNSHYIPFPVAAAEKRNADYKDAVRILCVAKLAQTRKQHFVLIEALERLADKHYFTLTLTGSTTTNVNKSDGAHLQRLRDYAQTGKLAGRIKIIEDAAFTFMPDMYRIHDICVLPSRKEPLGSSPLEGMAYGCVPIISDDCGAASTIRDGAGGFVFPVDDVAALEKIILRLLTDRRELARQGQLASHYAGREFGADVFVDRFEKVFASL